MDSGPVQICLVSLFSKPTFWLFSKKKQSSTIISLLALDIYLQTSKEDRMYRTDDETVFSNLDLSPLSATNSSPHSAQSHATNWWNWGYDWTCVEQSSGTNTSVSSVSGGSNSIESSFSDSSFVISPQVSLTPARRQSIYTDSIPASNSTWNYDQGSGSRVAISRPPHAPHRYVF